MSRGYYPKEDGKSPERQWSPRQWSPEEEEKLDLLNALETPPFRGSTHLPRGVPELITDMSSPYIKLDDIIQNRDWHRLNRYHTQGILEREEEQPISVALNLGEEELAEWLYDNGYRDKNMNFVVEEYIQKERMGIVRKMLQDPAVLHNLLETDAHGHVFNALLRTNHREWVEYLIQHGFDFNPRSLEAAISSRNMDLFRWVWSIFEERDLELESIDSLAETAASVGSLPILQFLVQHDILGGPYMFLYGVGSGNLDVVRWLHQQGYSRGNIGGVDDILPSAKQTKNPDVVAFVRSLGFIDLDEMGSEEEEEERFMEWMRANPPSRHR